VSEFKYFKQLKIKQVCNRIETKSSKLLLFQLTLSRRTTYIYIYICHAVSPLNGQTAIKVDWGGGGDLIVAPKG